MIFSNTIYKIGSGNNITVHALNDDSLEIYSFNKTIQKITFYIDKPISKLETLNINYEYVKNLGDNLFAVGQEKNISVINEL